MTINILILLIIGCGKTTELREYANDLKDRKVPVVLINIREYQDEVNSEGVVKLNSMNEVSKRVCQQIGHPTRRFILHHLFSKQNVNIFSSDISITPSEVLKQAFFRLFQCCADLTYEMRGQSHEKGNEAAVIIIDEVHDLIKDGRLANAGGKDLFKSIGPSIVRHSVDNRLVKFILAASSYALINDYARSGCFNNSRFTTFELSDFEPEIIKKALIAQGYTSKEAQTILNFSGPRLRLINGPLLHKVDIDTWKKRLTTGSLSAFSAAFEKVSLDERLFLEEILNKICDQEPVKLIGKISTFMTKYDLSPILYLNEEANVTFQSEVRRQFWVENRRTFMKYIATLP